MSLARILRTRLESQFSSTRLVGGGSERWWRWLLLLLVSQRGAGLGIEGRQADGRTGGSGAEIRRAE